MKKENLEKQRLHEGLNRPINQQSKGYELLSKMGYKPGMTLGKKRDEEGSWLCFFYLPIITALFHYPSGERITEPVAIQTQFISSRLGLGHKGHKGHIKKKGKKLREELVRKEELLKKKLRLRGLRGFAQPDSDDDVMVIEERFIGPIKPGTIDIIDDGEGEDDGEDIDEVDDLLGEARVSIREADHILEMVEVGWLWGSGKRSLHDWLALGWRAWMGDHGGEDS
jgi:hypothetical protein